MKNWKKFAGNFAILFYRKWMDVFPFLWKIPEVPHIIYNWFSTKLLKNLFFFFCFRCWSAAPAKIYRASCQILKKLTTSKTSKYDLFFFFFVFEKENSMSTWNIHWLYNSVKYYRTIIITVHLVEHLKWHFYTFDFKYNSTLLEFLYLIYDWSTKYLQVSNLQLFSYILSLFW